MKVLVTGATGFIGREIVGELENNSFEVFSVGNSHAKENRKNDFDSPLQKIDIRNKNEVRKLENLQKVDAIIHSAGLAHQFGTTSKAEFYKTNVEGTENILELAKTLNSRHFVLISSTAVYGTEKKKGIGVKVIDENTRCSPQTFYAESKLKAEQTAIVFCEKNDLDLTVFRLAPVIGEGSAGNVLRMIETIDKRRFVWIGNGDNYKSLIDKKDVARACRRILEAKKSKTEIFNLAAKPILMYDFVNRAAELLHRKIPGLTISPKLFEIIFEFNDRTFKLGKLKKVSQTIEKWLSDDVYSADKIEAEYDFRTETPILEALEKQINFYRHRTKDFGNVK